MILTLLSQIGQSPVKANQVIEYEFGTVLQEEQNRMSDLYRLQKAIAVCEGGLIETSLAYRNNNPGNLKARGKTDSQGHTIYPNRTQGYLAHFELLQRRYWGHSPKYMNHVLGYATDPDWHVCVEWYYYDQANKYLTK